MKTFNPSIPAKSFDKRTKKVAALRAVLHGHQPVSSLQEYRKRPEWSVSFWITSKDGAWECIETEPFRNGEEDDNSISDGNALFVKLERFRQLEQIWRQTSNMDKKGTNADDLDDDSNQMPFYESIRAMISDDKEFCLLYSMDISSELYLSHFKPFRDSIDTNSLIGRSIYDESTHRSMVVWNDPGYKDW